jgi:hypothetical protein
VHIILHALVHQNLNNSFAQVMTVTEIGRCRSNIEFLMRVDVSGNVPVKLINTTLVGRADYLVEIRDFFESKGPSVFLNDNEETLRLTDLQEHASNATASRPMPAPPTRGMTTANPGSESKSDTHGIQAFARAAARARINKLVRETILCEQSPLNLQEIALLEKGRQLRILFNKSTRRRNVESPFSGLDIEIAFIEGSALAYLRVRGTVMGSPPAVCAFYEDPQMWRPSPNRYFEVLDRPNAHCCTILARFESPLPLQPREGINTSVRVREPDGKFIIASFPSLHANYPENRTFVRMYIEQVFAVSLTEGDENCSEVEYIMRVDAGGFLPAKVLNVGLISRAKWISQLQDFFKRTADAPPEANGSLVNP